MQNAKVTAGESHAAGIYGAPEGAINRIPVGYNENTTSVPFGSTKKGS